MEEIQNYKNNFNTFRISQMLIRFLTSISIFAVTVFFTPNFNLSSFPILIISGIAIIILDYLMSIITGIHDVPLGRGLVGFTIICISFYLIIWGILNTYKIKELFYMLLNFI